MIWLLVLVLAGGSSASATAVGIALALLASASSPIWLRYLPWSGAQMTAFTMLVALAIALIASWLTGNLTLTREGIVQALLESGGVWTVQQAVYAALRQWAPNTGLWVVSPPVLAVTPPAPTPRAPA